MKIKLKANNNQAMGDLLLNIHASRNYPRVEWAVLKYPMCAVVGGGYSLKQNLEILREWDGDIFAVNDTAAFLSDNGIPSYIFAIDATPVKYRYGKLIKGALYASRVHKNQFRYKDTRIFELAADIGVGGVQGSVSAVGNAPHLFLRMGYRGVAFFGCDGSFYYDTHVTGTQNVAFDDMIIVRVGRTDYLTNASLLLQSEYLANELRKHPDLLVNASDGLLSGLEENPDYDVVAIGEDLKKKYDDLGFFAWNKEHNLGSDNLWRPQQLKS